MKKMYPVIILSINVLIVSCQSSGNNHAQATTRSQQAKAINQVLNVDDYEKKLVATPNAQLIDVRTPGEYAEGHLKNARNIDINAGDFEDQLKKLDKSRTVFVYCLSGGRSATAAQKMGEMGFAEVYNMDGGIMKWQSAGKPVEKGPSTPSNTGLSMDDYTKLVSGDKYVLVDFSATWCQPCKRLAPILESIAEKKKDKIVLQKIDADDNKDLVKQKGISGIPYLELYKDGKLLWKHQGFIEEDEL